ncbi:DUF4232 domain-containing protein [Granulicella sp. S190]|uniref:DUF4232 domain-containing protein n=1 Tax=Granulicella sp. S190 TaxID=1747226 RepID=UPI00131B1556|nr:DUF4232 domain-containing protein [Granulicella sp. S190]
MTKPASNAVYVVVAVVLILASSASAAPLPSASALLACTAAQLSLSFDGEGGNFDGMSQSGTLLVLRNIGSQTCTVSGRPALTFEDASNTKLPISLETPPGMHPGPVILPVAIPANAEATGELHWVSSEVFDNSKCFTPAAVAVSIGTDVLRAPFTGHLCGPSGQDAKYRFAYLKRDPVYVRSKS